MSLFQGNTTFTCKGSIVASVLNLLSNSSNIYIYDVYLYIFIVFSLHTHTHTECVCMQRKHQKKIQVNI